jgi:hypothetical protein
MAERFLQPTVVQEIREFLRAEGLEPRPWSGATEVLEALLELLNSKKDIPAFWGPLEGLLSRVVARQEMMEAFEASYGRDAEVLGSGELRCLVAELRGALPGSETAAWQPLMGTLRDLKAPALAGALLLLVVVGCDSGSSDDGGGNAVDVQASEIRVGDDVESSADDVHPSLTDFRDAPLKNVYDYLEESDLPSWTKKDLEECLSMFSESERQDLVDLFQSKTPEEIADHLENLVQSWDCQQYLDPMDVYKGISFPVRRSTGTLIRDIEPSGA